MTELHFRFVPAAGVAKSLHVTDTPLIVPNSAKKSNLNELLNHLLGLDPPRKFGFFLKGHLVEGSLGKAVQEAGLSKEEVFALEYAEKHPKPSPHLTIPHDDWVSCVDASVPGYLLTGSYDNNCRIFNSNGDRIATFAVHTQPISGVTFMSTEPSDADSMCLVVASKDHSLSSWKVNVSSGNAEILTKYAAHSDSVMDVVSDSTHTKFASASWDHTINIWHLHREEETNEGESSLGKRAKRRRKNKKEEQETSLSAALEKAPICTLRGHSNAVSCVKWPNPHTLYSASWDHTVGIWDVETTAKTMSLASQDAASVISGMDVSLEADIVASGHQDSIIRIWDRRAGAQQMVKMSLHSHKSWVSSVAFHPSNPHVVSSCGHDGSLFAWDLRRGDTPAVAYKKSHSNKALCIGWMGDGENKVVSGGADCKLHITPFVL